MSKNSESPEQSSQPSVDFDQAMNMRFEFRIPLVDKLMKKLGRGKRDLSSEVSNPSNSIDVLQSDPMAVEDGVSSSDKRKEIDITNKTNDLLLQGKVDSFSQLSGISNPHELPEVYVHDIFIAVKKEQADNEVLRTKGSTTEYSDAHLAAIEKKSKTIHAFYEAVFMEAEKLKIAVDEKQVQAAFERGRKITARLGHAEIAARLSKDGTVAYDHQIGGYYGTGAAELGMFFDENQITDKNTQSVLALAFCSGAIENGAPAYLVHHVRDWLVDIRTNGRELGDFVRITHHSIGEQYPQDWASRGISNVDLFLATHESSEIVNDFSRKTLELLQRNSINPQTSSEWRQYLDMKNGNEFLPTPNSFDFPPKFAELPSSMASEAMSAYSMKHLGQVLDSVSVYIQDRKTALDGIGDTRLTDSDEIIIHKLLQNAVTRIKTQDRPGIVGGPPKFNKMDDNQSVMQAIEKLRIVLPQEYGNELEAIAKALPNLKPVN